MGSIDGITHTCIEVPHKPSIEDVHMTLKALASTLKGMGCEFAEGASWIIARCPGSLVEASVVRPRALLEAPSRPSALVRVSGDPEGVYRVASRLMKALRELGLPVELMPGCLRIE